ncbi:hypothetical protein ACH5RR_028022 [Cinchona calisaya]|uniref:Uncharacterized protein n=1 Tax=Cinchona calisaya TaxID=153742 RepID=A0ABD2YNY2_9GENT
MGIWDELHLSVSRLMHRKPPSKLPATDAGTASDGRHGAQKLDENFPDPHRREKISRVLTNLGKFAVDSAVNESLKGVTGGVQVYKMVREGLKDQPNSRPYSGIKKQDLMVAMEEMQAKMEKMQEDVNILKLKNHTCAEYSKELDPLKEFTDEPEPAESSASAKTDKKKIFIRSRL